MVFSDIFDKIKKASNEVLSIEYIDVDINKSKTRIIVDYYLISFGKKYECIADILVVGNDKDILKNTWILKSVVHNNKMKIENLKLNDETKKSIYDFYVKTKNKKNEKEG